MSHMYLQWRRAHLLQVTEIKPAGPTIFTQWKETGKKEQSAELFSRKERTSFLLFWMLLSTSQLAKYFCYIVWGDLSSLCSLPLDCKCMLSEVHQNKECAWTVCADVELINDWGDSFSNSGYFYSSWAVFILRDVHKVLDWTGNACQHSTEESLQDLDWNKYVCANPDCEYVDMWSEVRMCWSRVVSFLLPFKGFCSHWIVFPIAVLYAKGSCFC